MAADRNLIEKVRLGDRKAFNAFCKERYPSLIAYARLFLTDYWADDVIQDVFFGVWQNRRSLTDDGSALQSYLISSVYHRCLNYIRKAKQAETHRTECEKRILSLVSQYYSPDSNPVIEKVFNADLRNVLDQAIEALPPRCREVFRMSYIDEMPNKQIAQKLGLSLSTVENHIYLALKELRLKLANAL
ncbi:MAG: RNA polymerase sigma-70 factor [Bacteroidales bacterium]